MDSQYPVSKNIKFKTPMLKSDLCDYGNAYFVVKGKQMLGQLQILIDFKKRLLLEIIHYLGHAQQKSTTHW